MPVSADAPVRHLFRKSMRGISVMLHGQQYNWIILRLSQLLLDVTDGVAEIGDTIGQKIFELVGRNDYGSSVDMAVLQVVAYVDDVPGKQVASARNLNLDPHPRYDSLLYRSLLIQSTLPDFD